MLLCNCRCVCATLTFLLLLTGVSYADYSIGYDFDILDFQSPSSAPNGSCCGSSCQQCCSNVSTLSSSCDFSVIICFRESNIPISDTLAPCGLQVTRINNVAFMQASQATRPVTRYFTGGFQAYIRISYVQNGSSAVTSPPFSDPVIDEYTFDFNVNLSDTFTIRSEVFTETGQFQRAQVRLSAFVECALNWNDSNCATFCNSSECTQVYSGPFQTTTPAENTTTTVSESPTSFTGPVTQPLGAQTEDSIDEVAIGVGVGVGVGGALLLCILLLLILLCCLCIRRKRRINWEPKQSYPYTVKPRENVVERPISTYEEPTRREEPTQREEPTRRTPPPKPQEEIELQEQQPPTNTEPEEEVQEDKVDLTEEDTASVASVHLYATDATASLYAKVDKNRKRISKAIPSDNEDEGEGKNDTTIYENVAATDPHADENEEDKESAL